MKRIKFLFVTILVLSFILTGCQDLSTSSIDLNQMLTKDTKEPLQAFEHRESISLKLDYDESLFDGDEDELSIVKLLSNAKLDLIIQKNDTVIKVDGVLILEKGEIPFVISINEKETIVWIDNAIKPFVYEGNILEEYQQRHGNPYLYDLTGPSPDELTEESKQFLDVIINNLPNPNSIKYKLYDRTTVNGKNVTLHRIDAKITGDELPAMAIQFLQNIKQDPAIKQFLRYVFDSYQSFDSLDTEEANISPEQKEEMIEEQYLAFLEEVDFAIGFVEDISESWMYDKSLIESSLYVNNEMRIMKVKNTFTFVTPDELRYEFKGLNGFTLHNVYERFNLNKDITIEPVKMENQTYITTDSSEEEAISSLNKNGVFYDILKNDFKVIPIQTMVLKLDVPDVQVNDENQEGKSMTLNVAPYVINGTTLVPVRFFSENLGAEVTWNKELEEVTIVNQDKTIILPLYEDIAYVNGEEYLLDVVTETKDGNAMVPLRFISEVFDLDVTWNGELREITLKQYK